MLTRAERLVSAADYRTTVRRGRRASSELVTVYSVAGSFGDSRRFGFIVSKTVGNAVVRNRVRRRLKAVCHFLLSSSEELPVGIDVVIRAHAPSADVPYAHLSRDVERLMRRSTEAVAGSEARA